MSFYQELKTAKAAAIGTIMPFTGNISDIPDGWIPCDGSTVGASDFPLLARAIGDTYNLSTAVTQGLINLFTNNASTETGRNPGTYVYSPLDGNGGGATFAIVVADAGTQAGGAPNGVGGPVTITRLTQGINYQVGDNLTVPSGQSGGGTDIIITVSSVETGSVSTFAGEFPNYIGEIVLPNLLNKPIVDLETNYFGSGSVLPAANMPAFHDPVTVAEVVPYIGANADSGVPQTFNDVTTDVVFELNERTTFPTGGGEVGYYYSGTLAGNTLVSGSGEGSKIMFFGPRKLGRNHLKSHRHSGRFNTVRKDPSSQPGEGVIPWSTLSFTLEAQVETSDGSIFVTDDNSFTLSWQMNQYDRGRSGFGGGLDGRIVAFIHAENPPVNWTPKNVVWSPIKSELSQPHNHKNFNEGVGTLKGMLTGTGGIAGFNKGDGSAQTVKYGIAGNELNLPSGQTNWYPDLIEYIGGTNNALSNKDSFENHNVGGTQTMNSNAGWDFNRTANTTARVDMIQAHTHDEVDIEFDRSGLRPLNRIEIDVSAPNPDTSSGSLIGIDLDNARNVGVFQINFNTSQPQMSCIYCIRAY